MGKYSKAIAAFLSSIVVWGGTVVASTPDGVTGDEWLGLAGVGVVLVTVFLSPANTEA